MDRLYWLPVILLALVVQHAQAQTVVRQDERLASDRPETWALNRVAASTLMTAFNQTPTLAPGQWSLSTELGEVPRLSASQRRVGFNGDKQEDLNKSPVFGRLRVGVGLRAGWVAELGYTPPFAINGARPRNLVALAIGRRVFERGGFTLSARAFGQHGRVEGDITCPAALVGVTDLNRNPYGCQSTSNDRISVNDYGMDLVSGWNAGAWHWHGDLGVVRTELQAQVDAFTFDVHDRSRLVASGVLRYVALGVGRDLGRHWRVATELLHVPLNVRRGPDSASHGEPLTSLRLQLRYTGN